MDKELKYSLEVIGIVLNKLTYLLPTDQLRDLQIELKELSEKRYYEVIGEDM
jgi:hypothetical protein